MFGDAQLMSCLKSDREALLASKVVLKVLKTCSRHGEAAVVVNGGE